METAHGEWEDFFDAHAGQYKNEIFAQNTAFEIDFLIRELGMRPGQSVLDLGCGIGRHAIGLAQHGLRVTGVDLSRGMLDQAAASAEKVGVKIELIHCDAQRYHATEVFDHAISLCEGALCLLGSVEDPVDRDIHILKNVFFALKPGGRFLLNVLNACRSIRAATEEDVRAGRFNPLTLVETSPIVAQSPDGPITFTSRERSYTAPELVRMLHQAGFLVDHVWGGTAGAWNKGPLQLDEYEIMALCHKNA